MQQFAVTKEANEVIIQASIAAAALNHDKQEPVHLLLALTMRDNHRAKGVLRRNGVTLERARPLVQHLPIQSYIGTRVIEQYSPQFVEVVNYAIEIARAQGKVANAGHLLIALIKYNDPHVAIVLSKLSVHPGNLVRAMSEIVDNETN